MARSSDLRRGDPANPHNRIAFLIALSAILAGCAELPAPRELGGPIEAPKLGALDGAYDRAKWKWVRNPDGRALLTHTKLQKCFVNAKPDQDFLDPGFTLKRGEKTIGPTRYEVVSVFEKRDLWEVIYMRPGSKAPVLGVFSTGKCQDEAELILQAYEKEVTKKSDARKSRKRAGSDSGSDSLARSRKIEKPDAIRYVRGRTRFIPGFPA